jgi:Tfp pilus assembly protein PilE
MRDESMNNQRGLTLIGMIVACIVIVIVAIGGLKIAPAYIEYFKVKKAIVAIAQGNPGATVGEVRYAFQLRQAIDDIDVIGPKDLEITKEGNEVVVSVAYPKRIPLFGNINVVIDFAASSNN